MLKMHNPAKELAGGKLAHNVTLKEPSALWTWVKQEHKKTPRQFFFILKDHIQPRWGNLSLACKPRPRFTPALVQRNMFTSEGIREKLPPRYSRYLHRLPWHANLVYAASRWWPRAQIMQHFQTDFVSILVPNTKKNQNFISIFFPFDFLCVH